jgi:hypothetical protein
LQAFARAHLLLPFLRTGCNVKQRERTEMEKHETMPTHVHGQTIEDRERMIAAMWLAKGKQVLNIPPIICLCGSTRFHKEYVQANYDLTLKGNIVLSVGFFHHAHNEIHAETVGITPAEKDFLDNLHKRKIDLADEVCVINPGGYIGESTRFEIEYAERTGKPVYYLVPPDNSLTHSYLIGKGEITTADGVALGSILSDDNAKVDTSRQPAGVSDSGVDDPDRDNN